MFNVKKVIQREEDNSVKINLKAQGNLREGEMLINNINNRIFSPNSLVAIITETSGNFLVPKNIKDYYVSKKARISKVPEDIYLINNWRVVNDLEEDFLKKLLPGKYWLTKSMEFTKISECGTLWHLKKYFVFYHYIFMKDTLYNADYREIVNIFDKFIMSLDESIRKYAKGFFYNIDIRDDDKFVKFEKFARVDKTFDSEEQKLKHKNLCKKLYFIYIMDIGGQGGYKGQFKEYLSKGYTFNEAKKELIKSLDDEDQEVIIREVENDVHSALRNERQIYFYYGLFHGKRTSDIVSGFHKFTPIGTYILNANFHELLIIWEHQKLKMISRSPISTINNLPTDKNIDYSNFNIDFHPYYSLIYAFNRLKKFSKEDYKYILSRIDNTMDLDNVIEYLKNKSSHTRLEELVKDFGRVGDIDNYDSNKEFCKYVLGISSIKYDKKTAVDEDINENTNYYAFLNKSEGGGIDNTELINEDKGLFIEKNYKKIIYYLDKNYHELYNRFNQYCKIKYRASLVDEDVIEDHEKDKNEYEWYRYIINFDLPILLCLIYISISMKNEVYDFNVSKNKLNNEYKNYKTLLSIISCNRQEEFVNKMLEVQNHLKIEDDVYPIEFDDKDYTELDLRDIKDYISEVTIGNLKKISVSNNQGKRKRNYQLKTELKKYYITKFTDDKGFITCDSCNGKTFLTEKNIPYLEFHHIIPFKEHHGPDHYINIVGICPSCHKKFHYAKLDIKKDLYNGIDDYNKLELNIKSRLDDLHNHGLLEPIHLDFLYKNERAISKEVYEDFLNIGI